MNRNFLIDCFPCNCDFGPNRAVVAIDVIRATTTAITAASQGRRCFPVSSERDAHDLAGRLHRPLLLGERGGEKPDFFHLNNSPAALAMREDIRRPVILLSSSGTNLLNSLHAHDPVYLACFRNFTSTANHLRNSNLDVALLGAASRGEFREEDQMCCAWIGKMLIDVGYKPCNSTTRKLVDRWQNVPAEECRKGNSAKFLQATGQLADLEFILSRIDDLDCVYSLLDGEVCEESSRQRLFA